MVVMDSVGQRANSCAIRVSKLAETVPRRFCADTSAVTKIRAGIGARRMSGRSRGWEDEIGLWLRMRWGWRACRARN